MLLQFLKASALAVDRFRVTFSISFGEMRTAIFQIFFDSNWSKMWYIVFFWEGNGPLGPPYQYFPNTLVSQRSVTKGVRGGETAARTAALTATLRLRADVLEDARVVRDRDVLRWATISRAQKGQLTPHHATVICIIRFIMVCKRKKKSFNTNGKHWIL